VAPARRGNRTTVKLATWIKSGTTLMKLGAVHRPDTSPIHSRKSFIAGGDHPYHVLFYSAHCRYTVNYVEYY
jgi:hypothetical protein